MYKADFTVATIAREPLPVLRRFLDWHLGQGAARIILFFDDPDDPAIGALKGEPRIDARPCTAALWTELGVDAEARFTRRQRAAMTAAYREAQTDWVLVLDADERMWFRDGSYGDDADLFRKREGLIGHCEGKAFHRSGMDRVNIKLHWAEDLEGNPLPGPVLGPQDRVHLVHDIAPDYGAWPMPDRITALTMMRDEAPLAALLEWVAFTDARRGAGSSGVGAHAASTGSSSTPTTAATGPTPCSTGWARSARRSSAGQPASADDEAPAPGAARRAEGPRGSRLRLADRSGQRRVHQRQGRGRPPARTCSSPCPRGPKASC
jgi:hypothetical protein